MGPIRLHGFARGLLSLVGAQNFGEAPNELASVVVPVVDVTTMYASNKSSFESLSANPPIAGINQLFTVPAGEVWTLEAADVRMSCGAGESVAAAGLVITLPSNAALMASDRFTCPANTLTWATLNFPGITLNAGCGIGYYADTPVGAVDVFVTIRIIRLTGA